MKIYSSSIYNIIKSIEGKRFLAECKPQKVNLIVEKSLKPVTDIDDEIVSYTVGRKPASLCTDSTPVGAVNDRMSFERVSNDDAPDIMRDNELYNYSTDYRPVQFSKYGEDDVNLSQTIINDLREPYGQTKLSNVYYPDTDLNFDSQSVLQHIHFKEQIVPSSFDPKMHVTPDVILQYASEATHAWENGVPTNEIIKQIGRSVISGNEQGISKPSVALFKFLTKFPKSRAQVVFASQNGIEHLDSVALRFYDSFSTRHFKDEKMVQQILNECKTKNEYPIKTADAQLCEIASLTRKKSAHGIETPNSDFIDIQGPISSTYCPKDTPWRECDSELLTRLKENGIVDANKYQVVKIMLKDLNLPVEKVLQNLDEGVAEQYKKISEIDRLFEENWNYSYANNRKYVHDFLENNFKKAIMGDETDSKRFKFYADCVQYLAQKNVIPSYGGVIRTCEILGEVLKSDSSAMKPLVEAVLFPTSQKGVMNIDVSELSSICSFIKNDTRSEKAKAEIIKLFTENSKETQSATVSAIEYLWTIMNKEEIGQITAENLSNLAPYFAKLKTCMAQKGCRHHANFIDNFLKPEILKAAEHPFEMKNCPKLRLIEKLADGEIEYTELLEATSKLNNVASIK